MKGYPIFSKAPRLEPHYQMVNDMSRTLVGEEEFLFICWFGFYGILTFVDYLMPAQFYINSYNSV